MIAFGPIPSRRLGTSLGINNIVSLKQCPYSCVYCQLGKTPDKNMLRRKCYEPEILFENVKLHLQKLDFTHKPSFLSLVANGEPTLDINLGMEIQLLRKFGIPIAVFTNSSLIDKDQVREDLMCADWVSVKIDTVDEAVWKRINQPNASLNFNKILEGVQQFANDYQGKLCTETMLIDGYNDNLERLEQTASFIAQLKPNTAYLAKPIRPPAISGIKPVSEKRITETWKIYNNMGIKTERLTCFEGTDTGYSGNIYEDILNIITVHPLREDTISELFKKDNADIRILESLVSQGLIKSIKHEGQTYYVRNYHY